MEQKYKVVVKAARTPAVVKELTLEDIYTDIFWWCNCVEMDFKPWNEFKMIVTDHEDQNWNGLEPNINIADDYLIAGDIVFASINNDELISLRDDQVGFILDYCRDHDESEYEGYCGDYIGSAAITEEQKKKLIDCLNSKAEKTEAYM